MLIVASNSFISVCVLFPSLSISLCLSVSALVYVCFCIYLSPSDSVCLVFHILCNPLRIWDLPIVQIWRFCPYYTVSTRLQKPFLFYVATLRYLKVCYHFNILVIYIKMYCIAVLEFIKNGMNLYYCHLKISVQSM